MACWLSYYKTMDLSDQFLQIKVTFHHAGKRVYSGRLDEVEEFVSRDQPADLVKLYGEKGQAVVTMRYQDFLFLSEKNEEKEKMAFKSFGGSFLGNANLKK